MEAVQNKKVSSSLEMDSFEPVNEYLLCKAMELPTHSQGGVLLPDSIRDIWGGRAEIILVSQDLNPSYNKFKYGQQIIYSRGIRVMDIWIDGEPYFLLHKREVGAVVKK